MTSTPVPASATPTAIDPKEPSRAPSRTKIIATLGPASSDPATVQKLVEAGVSIFRLNFSHGEASGHEQRVRAIREASAELDRPLAVMGDLPGPKIRVGETAEGGVEVESGAEVIFQREPIVAEAGRSPLRFGARYSKLVDDVRAGERLLVNDGAVRMLIVDRGDDEIRCAVTHGGTISSGKGINLPDTDLSLPPLRDRDWAFVRWAVEHDLDWIAMSFVSRAEELEELRAGIEAEATRAGRDRFFLPIVAKIERPRALDNIEAIVDTADAVMVARGDLGVEMDIARVPVIQRQLIRVAHDHGKPCIVATQMLESMIERPQPTRAEVSDVATAIVDDVDAVMLSGETAVGRYPVVTVQMMRRIAEHTEGYQDDSPRAAAPPSRLMESRDPQAALAHGVWTVANDVGACVIVIWSQTGTSARYLSKNSFRLPIIAVSSDERVVRQMQMLRGIRPVRMAIPENLAVFTAAVDGYLLSTEAACRGELAILVAGWPIGPEMVTNSLAIHQVGDPSSGYAWHR